MQESIVFTLARWLEINDSSRNLTKLLKDLGFELKDKRDTHERESTMDENKWKLYNLTQRL